MRTVNAIAAPSATEPLIRTTIERRAVGPKDVLIDIAYSGVCHSDIHTVRGEWGDIQYPQVVGHEIVGTVSEIGSEVTKHKVGDRVGVGCMVNSCGECEYCVRGDEQYCTNGKSHSHSRSRVVYGRPFTNTEGVPQLLPSSIAIAAALLRDSRASRFGLTHTHS